jgi:pimeloyl-ACP methyl ester carboxylesterase
MSTAESFDVMTRSHRLRVRRWGSAAAPLVLALPGLSGNAASFDFLGERLGDDRRQVVALDLRGRGYSDASAPGTYGWINHALDVLDVASALGFARFALIGRSMGGSVAMKIAELDAARLRAVVLLDIAGRVDRGVGAVIASEIEGLDDDYESADAYVEAVKASGLREPWNEYRDRACRYDLEDRNGRVRRRTSIDAVREDRADALTQHPYERWQYLTMPTLLVRATRELRPGAGFVVPADDRDAFVRDVPQAIVVEVDASHLTIDTHPDTAGAIRDFIADR